MKQQLPPIKQRIAALINTASVSSVSPEWDMSNLNVINLLADWFEQFLHMIFMPFTWPVNLMPGLFRNLY
jgi:hypothetical protein